MSEDRDLLDVCLGVLTDAHDRLGPQIQFLPRNVRDNLGNWTKSESPKIPNLTTAREAAGVLWTALESAGDSKTWEEFSNSAQTRLGLRKDQWTADAFAKAVADHVFRWTSQRRDTKRLKRAKKASDASPPSPAVSITIPTARPGPSPNAPGFHKADPVVVAVNQMIQDWGFAVFDGQAIVDSSLRVDLTFLYGYIRSLQKSAEIPSYFPGVPSIRLDELYVELSAAENQRGIVVDDPNTSTWQDVDKARPDHLGLWRIAAGAKRIPLATLLSRTQEMPAVVFGDPGSGKSCLTQFALHELGRGLLDSRRSLRIRAFPFRISLREFARDGRPDGYSILRHLAQHHLRVPDQLLDDWVTLLSHLFSDIKPARLLLIIDGIDEVTPDAAEYARIQRQFSDATSIARMVFTSRRAGFHPPTQAYHAFELIELSESSIHAMIRNWFHAVKLRLPTFVQSFVHWVFADSRRQDMAGNPCLLGLLCFLNQDRDEGDFLQARSRTALYRLAVEKLAGACSSVTHAERQDALRALAGFALDRYRVDGDQKAPLALFNREDVGNFLQQTTRDRGSEHRSTSLDRLMASWREMRLVAQWDLATWHHFLHLTFQEYFAAIALSELPETEVDSVIERHRFSPYWREVWRFYAGICRNRSKGDTRRVVALIRGCLEPADLFGECAYFAAPLCAEAGLRDTTAAIGFDLRDHLYSDVRNRHGRAMDLIEGSRSRYDPDSYLEMQELRTNGDPQLIGRIRVMVEMDPGYFFHLVRSVIEANLGPNTQRGRSTSPAPTPGRTDTLLAVLILGCIYHPSALEYQTQLIRDEAANANLEARDPPVGPRTATGRNEALFRVIQGVIPTSRGWIQRHRLVAYLAYTRSPEAAAAILGIARTPIPGAKDPDMLRFRSLCLEAICDLQDPLAVELARELWASPEFSGHHVDRACQSLCKLKVEAAASLMEEWLIDSRVDPNGIAFEQLITALKEWRERPVPGPVEAALANPRTAIGLRVRLWDLILARTGVTGQRRLAEKLRADLGKPRLGDARWHELAAIAQLIARERLPLRRELEQMAQRAPRQSPLARQRIWGALIELTAATPQIPMHREWLANKAIPMLVSELTRTVPETIEIPRMWMESLAQCPRSVLQNFAESLEPLSRVLDDDVFAEVLQTFAQHRSLLPKRLIEGALASKNPELNLVAWEALLELDPGRLVALRGSNPDVETLLRETSSNAGVLFFADRMYSPSIPGFVPYARPRSKGGMTG